MLSEMEHGIITAMMLLEMAAAREDGPLYEQWTVDEYLLAAHSVLQVARGGPHSYDGTGEMLAKIAADSAIANAMNEAARDQDDNVLKRRSLMANSNDYGAKSWLIVTCDGPEVNLWADRLEVQPSGALVAWGGWREYPQDAPYEPVEVYGIAAGKWHTFAAISFMNGCMVAVDE